MNRNHSYNTNLHNGNLIAGVCARKSKSYSELDIIDTFDYGPLIRFNLNTILLLIQYNSENDDLNNSSIKSMKCLLSIIGNQSIYIDDMILKTKPNVFVSRFFQTIQLKVDAIGLKFYGIKSPMFIFHENFPITKMELEFTEHSIINVIKNRNPDLKFTSTFFDDFWYKVCPFKYATYKDTNTQLLVYKESYSSNYTNSSIQFLRRLVYLYPVIIIIIAYIFHLLSN